MNPQRIAVSKSVSSIPRNGPSFSLSEAYFFDGTMASLKALAGLIFIFYLFIALTPSLWEAIIRYLETDSSLHHTQTLQQSPQFRGLSTKMNRPDPCLLP
jgi:hypothetical protein